MIGKSWEEFVGKPTESTHTRIHVTIDKGHRIRFNSNIFKRMGKPEAVRLSYNRDEDKIALKPSSPRFTNAFPIRTVRNSFQVNAAPFCRHFGIKITSTHKFLRPEFEGESELVLKLSETIRVERVRTKAK